MQGHPRPVLPIIFLLLACHLILFLVSFAISSVNNVMLTSPDSNGKVNKKSGISPIYNTLFLINSQAAKIFALVLLL